MDGCHLQRLRRREVGKDGREPFGEHRLAHTWRSVEEQVVTSRRRDLEHPSRLGMAYHVA